MRALCVGRNSFDRSVTRRYGRPAQRQAKDKRKSCGTPRAFFCRCTPVLPFVSLPPIVLFFGRRGHCRSLPLPVCRYLISCYRSVCEFINELILSSHVRTFRTSSPAHEPRRASKKDLTSRHFSCLTGRRRPGIINGRADRTAPLPHHVRIGGLSHR